MLRAKPSATAVIASLLVSSGCVSELPGVVYHVHLQGNPDIGECTELATGIASVVGVPPTTPYIQEFRPWSNTKKTCLVVTANNAPMPCDVTVSLSNRDPVIAIGITNDRRPLTASCEDIARRIRILMVQRYPTATITEMKPVQGPFAP
jgi:hypothetical protein